MSRTAAFDNVGKVWWNWVQESAPPGKAAALSPVASLLGVSAQTVHAMINGTKQCTIDRMVNYTGDLCDHGWPSARVVIDNGKVWIENSVECDTLSKDSAAAVTEASSLENTDGDSNYGS
tara:strand:- start:735 stop:1094 length:360 start_codon:yes stop_codon:yes gene_type:complete